MHLYPAGWTVVAFVSLASLKRPLDRLSSFKMLLEFQQQPEESTSLQSSGPALTSSQIQNRVQSIAFCSLGPNTSLRCLTKIRPKGLLNQPELFS